MLPSLGRDPVARDPEPSVPRIAKLAHRVLDGDILLPKFQRGFVWNRKQVLDLLDSVARNYPIGSILLWRSTQELASERTIAGLSIASRPPGYPVNYLLDGQQRLSTICGALYWRPNGDPVSQWNVAYDLEQQSFLHVNSLDDPPPHQVPVRLLSDPSAYFRWLSRLDSQELRDEGDRLLNVFQDYSIAVVTLGDMPIEAIAPVFERINSTGTPLTIVELMRAATWRPDFDLLDSIDAILAVLDEKNYGKIDSKVLLRAISAVAGFGFSRENIEQLRSLEKDALDAVVRQTGDAARHAVDFLTTEIKTPTSVALPYDAQFAVLTTIFGRLPKPNSVQYAAIRRWFWRSVLDGRFRGGWGTPQMAADREAIREFAAGTTDEVGAPLALPRSDIWRRTPFRSDNAISKMLALMLAGAGPMDLRTGLAIDPGKALLWANDKEWHHFFPKAFLKRQGVSADQANVPANIIMLTSISNIWISDQVPSRYLQDLCDTDGEDVVRERLTSCLVSDEAFDAAMRDDYEGFLVARSKTLHQRAMKLMGEKY
ncbi:hypothetical protein FHX82_003934 [Amycolatopsis bartoniae]|uniref:GmrSD restriction endonucleases N-terminal domain-containing protein n=1 Tax=Amycolatopsis bartoniae TaxID=941986 RepID=A0A8H9IR22_9PSEU|nr:DUF262 domain-containing protein [Amycolatopsis bartoniae]MBB2936870.1 hypothetical protein [Amycolatopsis bartoniae]TVT07246.1 DUF262 domain-containing protein [Amycolatopsis bartoniae]GHF50792.1 hypothetical protein GCM10017566_24890 [Amycolatopsis bartoniae]